MPKTLAAIVFAIALASAGSCVYANDAVLSMSPVGYWPANEGKGKIIHDLSPNANHAKSVHVPWDKGKRLLDFTGAYQWLEIPKHKAYQSPAFSMGGWVFTRSVVIGSGWVNRQGMLLIGNRHWLNGAGAQLCIRKQEMIDVVMDGKEDVLGTRLYERYRDGKRVERAYGTPSLAVGKWYHLLYTFRAGTGRLYLNGELIASKDGIKYKPANANLQIGNDAYWWHQMAGKSGSLDGSVRDMVWFDRDLAATEAARLYDVTKPAVKPDVYDDCVIILDGRAITIKELTDLPPATRQTALRLFRRKDAATLQLLTDALLPTLTVALDEANCRLPAAELLIKLDSDAAHTALRNALPKLTAAAGDKRGSDKERADAVLALARMGKVAAQAVPALAGNLDKLVPGDNVRPPRIEERLRNALTLALLEIDPKNERARKVLQRTFAKPMMTALDFDRLALAKGTDLRSMIEAGRHLEAMELYSTLHRDEREFFFSYKAPKGKDRDYTATAHYNGATYKVGTGVAWQGVEKISEVDYKDVVAELARAYPAARDWRKPDFEHLYRVPVTKIDAAGKEQKMYLEGRNFILDGHDAKCRAWSIFVDELGYVHLMGGQHNKPNPNYYIPGSWEKIGISRDNKSNDYPMQMYWVSTRPESVDSFKFAGQRSNSQAIPADYLNYLCFAQSPSNETYLYGRAQAFGWQCWGMFLYNAAARKWTAVGGDPYDLIESARRHIPGWIDLLHDPVRGSIPRKPSDIRRLAWAWQPAFYNFCRDDWGVRFDKTGRMHVRMQISGLDGEGYVRPTAVYAWSDDRGETFHRADGSPVKLPLTVNPAPEHNAEIDTDNTLQKHNGDQYTTRQWQELWLGLIKKAGYRI